MPDDDLSNILGVPRVRVPIEMPETQPEGAVDYPPPPPDEPGPGRNSVTDEPPEDLLYVMGSSRDGSIDPDNRTAPPAKSAIQTDTYKSWEPPLYAAKVSVSSLSVGVTTTINTGAAHNIPTTGGPYLVIISGITGITSTPSINGKHWATATDADTFTIPLLTSGTLGGAGLVGLYCNGVKVNEWVRFYKVASGGSAFNESVWTRSEKKWNRGQFYVSEETLANVATISGSGSGGGGL